MVGAVGQAGDGLAAAEEEVGAARIADRPAAGLLGELEQGAALAERNDIVDQLGLGLGVELVGMRQRGIAPDRRTRDPQHVRMDARLARARRRRGRRLGAPGKSEPMHLADHGVAGDAPELCGNLGSRQPVGPKLFQRLDALVSPAHASGSSEASAAMGSRPQNPTTGLGNLRWARRVVPLPIYAKTRPPHEMSYPLIEKLQYGESQAQESDLPASTSSTRLGARRPHLSSLLCSALTFVTTAAPPGVISWMMLTLGPASIECRAVP